AKLGEEFIDSKALLGLRDQLQKLFMRCVPEQILDGTRPLLQFLQRIDFFSSNRYLLQQESKGIAIGQLRKNFPGSRVEFLSQGFKPLRLQVLDLFEKCRQVR